VFSGNDVAPIAADAGRRAGCRRDQDAVADELLDPFLFVDQQAQPDGLSGRPLDPGVVERQRRGPPPVQRLDLDPQERQVIEHQVPPGRIKPPRVVEQESEVAGVDAEEGDAPAPVLADGPQHGAVAAGHHDQLGIVVGVGRQPPGHREGFGVALVGDHLAAQPLEPEPRLAG
jgi:hypothetical protein